MLIALFLWVVGAPGEGEGVYGQERRSWAGTIPALDFPPGLEWLNVQRPLTWEDLRGKAVVLDFWTYGCINCLHNLPGLLRLQEEFADELVIIGVHSAKFPHEGETDHIRRIAQRYELDYPIVNDRDFLVFRSWGARAWPTLVLIDPAGMVVGAHTGEGAYPVLRPVLEELVAEFDERGLMDRRPLEPVEGRRPQPPTVLSFPGKVLGDPERGRVFVADTHHHRIVVADAETGEIQTVVGSGVPGLLDGDFSGARFTRPQGMALSPDGRTLFVADSGNHALRRVLLEEGRVETVAGTGRQASFYPPRPGAAPQVELSSPWDLVLDGDRLYVAMAGSHQVWEVILTTGQVHPLAGNGFEGTIDGPGDRAELAQPMGLALSRQEGRLYFVDTEGSSVRWVELSDGARRGRVGTLAGSGASLFDFGDADGVGREARFQHPRGIAYYEGFLYVADTYNGKIKRVDPRTGEAVTFLGSTDGWRDGDDPLFFEPGGVHAVDGRLYVADTNNHLVRVVDLASGYTRSLVLWGAGRHRTGAAPGVPVIRREEASLAPGEGQILLDVELPPGYGLNELAPSTVTWRGEGAAFGGGMSSGGVMTDPAFPLVWDVVLASGTGTITVDLELLYCLPENQGLCYIEQARLEVPVRVESHGPGRLELRHTVTLPEDTAPGLLGAGG